MDSLGHVNNATYLSYFEEGRVHYFRDLFGIPVDDVTKFGMIVLEVKCTYKSPAFSGETLIVYTRVSKLKNKSFDMEYLISDLKTNRTVAEGTSVMVGYDYKERKSVELSNDFRKKISALEGIPERASS